jgi:L-ascorbate metabolism protein UlaG (beta-lactamase superfamily)
MLLRVAALVLFLWVGTEVGWNTDLGLPNPAPTVQTRSSLEITYIANEGFLVSAGPAKLLIDALHENPWGYENTPDSVLALMKAGDPRFDGVALMVASHPHADHFSPSLVHDYLVDQPEVLFVGSGSTLAQLQDSIDTDFASIEGQVREATPAWGESEMVRAGDITARFLTLNHAESESEPVLTLGSLIELNGWKVLHLADLVPETSESFLRGYGLATEAIDVAFVDPYFATSEVGQILLRQHVRPTHIVLMHVMPHEQEPVRQDVTRLFPEAFVFTRPMETKVYSGRRGGSTGP